jgi:hypothetical protein
METETPLTPVGSTLIGRVIPTAAMPPLLLIVLPGIVAVCRRFVAECGDLKEILSIKLSFFFPFCPNPEYLLLTFTTAKHPHPDGLQERGHDETWQELALSRYS